MADQTPIQKLVSLMKSAGRVLKASNGNGFNVINPDLAYRPALEQQCANLGFTLIYHGPGERYEERETPSRFWIGSTSSVEATIDDMEAYFSEAL